jgi:hypothetical protein
MGELKHRDRCTCVVDGVRCSMGRATPKSRNDRCEGCSAGLHKGHRPKLTPAYEPETFLVKLEGGDQPGTYTASSADMPWPLPDVLVGDETGHYRKVSQSKLDAPIEGLLRGVLYRWESIRD